MTDGLTFETDPSWRGLRVSRSKESPGKQVSSPLSCTRALKSRLTRSMIAGYQETTLGSAGYAYPSSSVYLTIGPTQTINVGLQYLRIHS
jgi:hypothetical protein